MTATMKGLLKGLRYISQIFEASDEEEPEMQIGNPTDVKHVAHIGWDGPTVNSPSWMNEFKSPSESSSAPLNSSAGALNDNSITRRHSEDVQKRNAPKVEKPSHFSSLDATSPTPEDRKQSRRRHSASGSINSPGRDIINGLKPRRHHQSSLGVDSSPNNIPSASASPSPSIPKKSRRKKSKDAAVDGSIKSGGGLTNEGSSKSSSGSSSKSRLKVRKSSEPKSALSDPRPSLTELDSPTSAFRALALNEKKNQDLDF